MQIVFLSYDKDVPANKDNATRDDSRRYLVVP
jgi:hypothetical protein